MIDGKNAGNVDWRMLGLSFWWGWFLWYFFPNSFSPGMLFMQETGIQRCALMLGILFGCIIVLVSARKIRACAMLSSLPFRVVVLLISFAGTILVELVNNGVLTSVSLKIFGIIVGGLSLGILYAIWSAILKHVNSRTAAIYVALSILCGIFIYSIECLAWYLGPALSGFFVLLMPGLCAFFAGLVLKSNKELIGDDIESGEVRPKPMSPLILGSSFIYSVVYAFMLGLATFSFQGIEGLHISNVAAVLGIAIAALCTMTWAMKSIHVLEYSRPFAVILTVVILGFLLLLVLDVNHYPFAALITVTGYILYWLFLHVILIDIARRSDCSAMRTCSQGLIAVVAGVAVGSSAYLIAFPYLQADISIIQTVIFITICILLISSIIILSERKASTLWGMTEVISERAQKQKNDFFSERADAITAQYGLTPRESEILAMLAKGRNTHYIQDKLVISHNTARTHVRNVYAKLDVHTHQELIDLFEDNNFS